MIRKVFQFSLTCAFVGLIQSVTILSTKAEILNLECHAAASPDTPVWLLYWIDTVKGTITNANASSRGVQTEGIQTAPVTITAGAYNFRLSMGQVTINRMTGVNTWYGPPVQVFNCSKGMTPFPKPKF